VRVAPFLCPGADLDLSSNRSFALQYRHRCCTGRNDPLWIPSTIAIFPIEICLQFVLLFVFICSSPWCEQADGSQGIVWKMINLGALNSLTTRKENKVLHSKEGESKEQRQIQTFTVATSPFKVTISPFKVAISPFKASIVTWKVWILGM
jgi:hypothetical protein